MDVDVTDMRSPYFGYPPDRPIPTAWHLLSMANVELIDLQVPARRITRLRRDLTGHVRCLPRPWLWAVGCFGRTHTAGQIAEILQVDADAVRSYARGRGLHIARDGRQMPADVLAAEVYVRRHENPRAVCKELGILPVELMLYLKTIAFMIGVHGDLGDLSEDEWNALWQQAPFPATPENLLPKDVAARRREVWARR